MKSVKISDVVKKFQPFLDNSKEVFAYDPFFLKRTATTVTVIPFITKIFFILDFLTQGLILFATQIKPSIANILNRIYHVCCHSRLFFQKI